MNIVEKLNAKVARDQASDDEVARIAGMTAEEYDEDVTQPDFRFELRDNGQRVEIFNRANGKVALTLTTEQAWTFYRWWNDGICPVCANEINVGEIVCDACFADAQRFPARADRLYQEAR